MARRSMSRKHRMESKAGGRTRRHRKSARRTRRAARRAAARK